VKSPVLNSYAADEFALSDNAYMPIQVAAGETDDPQLITLLNSLVRGLVKAAKKQRDLTSRTLRFR
jgi:hypothetical protein